MGGLARSFTTANKKVGNLLLKLGAVDPQQFENAMSSAETSHQRIEDAVVELGLATEQDLLKALATHYKTRFVSTERLAKADIGRSTLEMVPRQVAETFQVFPVLFDPQSRTLSVVTADPDDEEVLKQIQITSGAKEVKAFVGRPGGVRAAIAKCYGGDIHAFALLDRAAHAQFSAMLDVYERNVVSDVSMTAALARGSSATGGRGERVVSERDMAQAQKRAATGQAGAGVGQEEMLELLNVLVSLLENARPDLRGHSAHVARFMIRCRDARVAFKLTAGLHHPMRAEYRLTYAENAPRGVMFGYLNMFVAATLAWSGAEESTVRAALVSQAPDDFAFSDESLDFGGHSVPTAIVRDARENFMISFGSCSFREPVDELAALSFS